MVDGARGFIAQEDALGLAIGAFGTPDTFHQNRLRRCVVGIWIELGVFLLVFVFAAHQMHDLKKEKRKREAERQKENKPSQGSDEF